MFHILIHSQVFSTFYKLRYDTKAPITRRRAEGRHGEVIGGMVISLLSLLPFLDFPHSLLTLGALSHLMEAASFAGGHNGAVG